MLLYKNTSNAVKTFHGVTFQPGDIKEVSGYINDIHFIRVNSIPQEPPKSVDSADKPAQKSAKSSTKQEKKPAKVEDKPEPAENINTTVEQEENVDGTDSN